MSLGRRENKRALGYQTMAIHRKPLAPRVAEATG